MLSSPVFRHFTDAGLKLGGEAANRNCLLALAARREDEQCTNLCTLLASYMNRAVQIGTDTLKFYFKTLKMVRVHLK